MTRWQDAALSPPLIVFSRKRGGTFPRAFNIKQSARRAKRLANAEIGGGKIYAEAVADKKQCGLRVTGVRIIQVWYTRWQGEAGASAKHLRTPSADKRGCAGGEDARCNATKQASAIYRGLFGTPDRSRTCDLQNRNLTLYPAELRVHARIYSICSRGDCPPFFEKGLQMCLHPRSGLSVICTESLPACSSSSKTISFSRSGSRMAPGR